MSKKEGNFFSYKTNTRFLSEFGGLRVKPLLKNRYKNERYSQEFMEENGFTNGEVLWINSIVNQLNEFYSDHRVSLAIPNSGVSADDKINLARFNSVPHFQYRPKAGARMFHSGPGSSYQSLSSSLRPFLRINGEETTEIDIAAATIQFAGAVSADETYDDTAAKVFRIKDPYQHFLGTMDSLNMGNMDRETLKEVLYTLIYSPKKSERSNVNRKLRLLEQEFNHDDLERVFPDFFKILDDIKSVELPDGEEGQLYEPHQIIFKEESRYAREVLRRCCLQQGFPVLPLHDSFIAPRKNSSELEEAMEDVSMEYYDYIMSYKTKF